MPENNVCFPSARVDILYQRAQYLEKIRNFFKEQIVLEVETPLLSRYATTDPQIESFPVLVEKKVWYLHTSPEFFMKRLLVAKAKDIYQITKVFRYGETGRYHNPEFTLLEWYRLDFNLWQIMQNVAQLIDELAIGNFQYKQYISYQDLFIYYVNIDPCSITHQALEDFIAKQGKLVGNLDNKDACLDYILTEYILPALPEDQYTFIYHYPLSQASLAAVYDAQFAQRFELYYGALELANGFVELIDAEEQRKRFYQDLETRAKYNQSLPAMDENFLQALQIGLPACAGVALGFDRLMLLALKAEHIEQVISFAFERV